MILQLEDEAEAEAGGDLPPNEVRRAHRPELVQGQGQGRGRGQGSNHRGEETAQVRDFLAERHRWRSFDWTESS